MCRFFDVHQEIHPVLRRKLITGFETDSRKKRKNREEIPAKSQM